MKNYVIIGGGITGLGIAHCLNIRGIPKENIRIITKDVGGQVKNNVFLGPRLLKQTESSTTFLKFLGVNKQPKIHSIGYLHEDLTITDEYTDEEREVYLKKSEREFTSSSMSEGLKYFMAWSWEDVDLLNALTSRYIDIIEIVDEELDDKKVMSYVGLDTQVICTVNIFHPEEKANISYISFFKPNVEDNYLKELRNTSFDYIYDLRKNSELKRINVGKDIILEVLGDVKELGSNYDFVAKLPQFYFSRNYEKYGRVLLEGRFARLDHSCKLENVIERWMSVEL